MHREASSDSGKTNNSMQFWPIEVQLALIWHAGYNLMSAIAGSPYLDSYWYSQKQPFLYSSFHHDMFFMHTWDWMLAHLRYCLFMICHNLQVFKRGGGWEIASHRSSRWAETGIQIPSLRALLMEIGSHNPLWDTGFWRPKYTSYSKWN